MGGVDGNAGFAVDVETENIDNITVVVQVSNITVVVEVSNITVVVEVGNFNCNTKNVASFSGSQAPTHRNVSIEIMQAWRESLVYFLTWP